MDIIPTSQNLSDKEILDVQQLPVNRCLVIISSFNLQTAILVIYTIQAAC